MAERGGGLRSVARAVTARTRALRWLLMVFALLTLPVLAAGLTDVVTGGREIVGPGVIYDGYIEGPTQYRGRQYYVHIRCYADGRTAIANSPDLYFLLGDRGRFPVEIEEDTFNHTISRVRAQGRWYLSTSYVDLAWLFLLVPLTATALLVIGANWLALHRARRARRQARHKARGSGG